MDILSEKKDHSQLLHCGISVAFHNKENRAPSTRWCKGHQAEDTCWAFSTSFAPSRLPIGSFIQHVIRGGAFTLGYFKSNRRIKANFVLSELLALDFDSNVSVERARGEAFIRQYAFLIYPTPSSTPLHPKTRVLFRLSEPVYEVGRWEAMQRGLIADFSHLQPDKSCKDASRLFYGSDREGSVIL